VIGAAWDKDTREGRERMPICGSFWSKTGLWREYSPFAR